MKCFSKLTTYNLAEFDTELNVCSLFRFEDHVTVANMDLHVVTKTFVTQILM